VSILLVVVICITKDWGIEVVVCKLEVGGNHDS
jgi:hypothetical protein